jgi:hypothetical protein
LGPDKNGARSKENGHGYDDEPHHPFHPPKWEAKEGEGERGLAPKVCKNDEARGNVENQQYLVQVLHWDECEVLAITEVNINGP